MRTQARSRRQKMYRSAFAMLALAAACTTGASCGSGGDGAVDRLTPSSAAGSSRSTFPTPGSGGERVRSRVHGPELQPCSTPTS